MHDNIITKIKLKEPLHRLDNEFIKNRIEKFLNANPKLKRKLLENKAKKKDIKFIVKNIRNELNRIYGCFWLGEKLSLESHKSTKERENYYSYIYSRILEITGKPITILDIAAGLNPLSYNIIGSNVYFISTELTDYDCQRIREIFRKDKIKGKVVKLNIFSHYSLPKADVCFIFKLLDIIETKGHKLAEKIIKDVNAKYVVVSFSSMTLKSKEMKYPRRVWFEVMVNRLGYQFTKFDIENEVFYIVKKFNIG